MDKADKEFLVSMLKFFAVGGLVIFAIVYGLGLSIGSISAGRHFETMLTVLAVQYNDEWGITKTEVWGKVMGEESLKLILFDRQPLEVGKTYTISYVGEWVLGGFGVWGRVYSLEEVN